MVQLSYARRVDPSRLRCGKQSVPGASEGDSGAVEMQGDTSQYME